MSEARLPVHGFVLAGGKSSRMGEDKALLQFRGRALVEIAVEKLRTFCAQVSISGNRDDLSGYAPVVHEHRVGVGPAAGIEAGLIATQQAWALFIPVDVPQAPVELLRQWATAVAAQDEDVCSASCLVVNGAQQPAFCMLRRECLHRVTLGLEQGERRLERLWGGVARDEQLWRCDAAQFAPVENPTLMEAARWFANLNTPEELAKAEAYAESLHPKGIS
jgi:molybdopterin-guanine dinucleotide biosynthesis protein A